MSEDTAQETPFDLNAEFEREVDANKAEKDAKELLATPGTYISIPEMTITGKVLDANHEKTPGRTVIDVAGMGEHTKTGEKTFIRAYLSFEPVYKEDGKTPDFRYGKWCEAVKAYKDTFGEQPSKAGQVIEYLQKHPVAFQLRRTDDGTMVVRISAVQQ